MSGVVLSLTACLCYRSLQPKDPMRDMRPSILSSSISQSQSVQNQTSPISDYNVMAEHVEDSTDIDLSMM